jgi:hypothetical protein
MRHGILIVANQYVMLDEEVANLVRSALFDSGPEAGPIDDEFRQIVYERVCDALEPHMGDTTAEFDNWFLGRKSSFFKQIAKRKTATGGPLDMKRVRQAMLEFGWDAYQYVAGCLSMQMQAVAEALPVRLNQEERNAFEEMHLPQPQFGGLPLLLLGERIDFVESVVWEICERPGDREPVAVLHRLLQYYAMMVQHRRQADRLRKEKQAGRANAVKPGADRERSKKFGDRGEEVASPGSQSGLGSEFAGFLLEKKGLECECAQPELDVDRRRAEGSPMIEYVVMCGRCEREFSIAVTPEQEQDLIAGFRRPPD